MVLYNDLYERSKDGDAIETEVNSHPARRTVIVQGTGILCKGEWFYWDFFFDVNHPVGMEIEQL